MLLSYEVREQHGRAVACKSAPRTGNVAEAGHEYHVDKDEHQAACPGEPGAPDGLVDEFIPERQVEIYTHHYLCRHHDGHHLESAPVVAADEMAQNVHISYHDEECQKGEDNKILHCLGVGFAVVLVLRLAEHERLIGIAERLSYHGHDHRYLAGGAVDAELRVSIGVLVDIRKENLVGRLIKYSGYTQHQYRPAVRQHAAHEGAVEGVFEARKLLYKQEHKRG